MRHIDEHILQLFTLDAPETRRLRASIEAHLQECAGCRALVTVMEDFGADVVTQLGGRDEPAGTNNGQPGSALRRER